MTNPTSFTRPAASSTNVLLQGGSTSSSAAVASPSMPPVFLGLSSSGSAAHVTLDLSFSAAMKAGSGTIYITDGAVQTVLDPATGMPTLRIVGANDTQQLSPASLRYEGDHVYIDAYGLKPGLNYSVIIAPGALASTADKAFAGLRSPGYASFHAAGGDGGGPALNSIAFDSATLKLGHDIRVTLTFSEKLAGLDEAAFTTPHAQITGLESTDGITWYGWLSATEPGIVQDANALTVNLAAVRDLAGNAGSGTATSGNYGIDTLVTTWVVPEISLYDDAGPYWDDLVSNGTSQLLEGGITGHIAEGQRFELVLDGVAVAPGAIELHEYTEGAFTATLWSLLVDLADGTHTVSARIVDVAGHSSGEVVRQIVIDNTAPVFTSSADGATAFGLDGDVVIRLAEPVYWEPSEGSDGEIAIEDREGNVSYRPFSDVQQSADGLTLTIPAAVLNLTAGNDYTIRLPSTLTDLAGNNFGDHAIHLHTAGEYVDVMPPRALSAKVVNPAGSYGVGAEIEIRIKFNEPVALASAAAPQLALNNGGSATFVAINGANEMVFKYVVAAGQDTWELDIADYSSVLGSVADLAGHRLDGDHVEFWVLENDSAETFGSDIVIVTSGPAPLARPLLDAASDSGTAGDAITSDTTPTLRGDGAEANALVELYAGDSLVGSAYADASGNWSVTSAPRSDGSQTFSVRQVDAVGNRSAASAALTVTIDSHAGAAPGAPVLDASSDTGLAGDNFTRINTPTVTGNGAEANVRIELYAGATLVGSGVANASGGWSITTSTLADGVASLTAVQVDAAGNRSPASAATAIKIRTTGGAAVSTPVLDAGSDSGTIGDRLTNDSTPTVKGGGAEPGATVELYSGSTLLGSALADGSGNWSVTASALADGNHSLTARQVDAAGNTSPLSSALALTIDTVANAAPGEPMLDSSSDSGALGDLLTNASIPRLAGGDAVAGATIRVYSDGVLIGTTTADGSGNWTVDSAAALGDGTHALTATQSDAAGNASPHSLAANLVVDTSVSAPSLGLASASDSGTVGDNITSVATPVLKGSAEAGATVVLYDGSTALGSTTADGSGNWSITSTSLASGNHALFARQTDLAGNLSIPSATLTLVVDTVAPAQLAAPDLATGSDSGTLGDRITNVTTPTLAGSGAEPGATIELYNGSGGLVGTTTADPSGSWSYHITAVFSNGGYGMTVRQVDAAGNASPLSTSAAFTFDTVVAAPNITLDFGSDPDGAWDYVTRDNTPTFNGTGEAGATVKLYADGSVVGSGTVDAFGNWTITSTTVADGSRSFTAVQTDRAGNVSAAGGPIPVLIDTTALTLPGFTLDSDTGSGHTTLNTPVFRGSGAEPGAKVELYAGADLLGSVAADSAGNWSVASHSLLAGSYSVVAKQTDKAGNTSPASGGFALTIDLLAAFTSVSFKLERADVGHSVAPVADGLAALVGIDTPLLAAW